MDTYITTFRLSYSPTYGKFIFVTTAALESSYDSAKISKRHSWLHIFAHRHDNQYPLPCNRRKHRHWVDTTEMTMRIISACDDKTGLKRWGFATRWTSLKQWCRLIYFGVCVCVGGGGGLIYLLPSIWTTIIGWQVHWATRTFSKKRPPRSMAFFILVSCVSKAILLNVKINNSLHKSLTGF